MEQTLNLADKPRTLTARVMAYPLLRIVLGVVLTFGAVPVVMIAVSQLVAKPYRMVWPQLLAALLVWFGYRCWVHRVEQRQPSELDTAGMAGQLGAGVLLGAMLALLTFALLGALGAYQLDGFNRPGAMLLIPLAELFLVAMTEEMVFRGVLFGVTERALGSKAAIAISALVFGLAHLPNGGVSVLAMAALAAYGVLQAALYLRTRRLWVCIGSHLAWNYCVGQVFASTVSGHAASDGLLRGALVGDPIFTGGAFGVEGSLITVLLIGTAAALALRRAR